MDIFWTFINFGRSFSPPLSEKIAHQISAGMANLEGAEDWRTI